MKRPLSSSPNSQVPHITFAERLVNTLGYHSAVHACMENQWLGILPHLKHHRVAIHSVKSHFA